MTLKTEQALVQPANDARGARGIIAAKHVLRSTMSITGAVYLTYARLCSPSSSCVTPAASSLVLVLCSTKSRQNSSHRARSAARRGRLLSVYRISWQRPGSVRAHKDTGVVTARTP
ncbi:hypothetical protein DICSQDRAFT_158243 [Dichomitus squalens LYAD-421 SS1]|uniref:Uncharacterized protein n=1 Tax=Dichomitus squalens (strain LYAD-421) TaxID=732165 RepID=R7SHM0_DICSQ|nr:uncharacterized protein DICSQDRAFT_158243 [Dichomitus squalens LYAD-421 SS1]EJF55656.1 hypothetical protein DICSQDRAFT_158243 [Dichomitus squalens LYAD-421 SS1]